jgi:23S rRNA (uracil1939-C5)-methyltransferase
MVPFAGADHLIESLRALKFRIGPKSFFQTNLEQALVLYETTLEFAELTGREVVYDLYTGTGTIANFVAGKALRVIGIETVAEAISDANENSRLNQIDNTHFVVGNIEDVLRNEFFAEHGEPDVIILDPPRAGMHPKVIKTLLEHPVSRLVYVSCNPATQARDLALLSSRYVLKRIQPVDMFPHTHHVENVVLLEKIGE